MSNFETLRFRQSTDILTPNIWYVYHDYANGTDINATHLINGFSKKAEAEQLYRSMLMDEITDAIQQLDHTQDVNSEFLELCLDDELGLISSVESFFSDCSFDISQLTPLKGSVSEFHTEVCKLCRPYIAISNTDQEKLFKEKADYYLTPTGQIVTFGKASTGGNAEFALMPLNSVAAIKIRDINFKKLNFEDKFKLLIESLSNQKNQSAPLYEVISKLYEALSGNELVRDTDPENGEDYSYKRGDDVYCSSHAVHQEVSVYFDFKSKYLQINEQSLFLMELSNIQAGELLNSNKIIFFNSPPVI